MKKSTYFCLKSQRIINSQRSKKNVLPTGCTLTLSVSDLGNPAAMLVPESFSVFDYFCISKIPLYKKKFSPTAKKILETISQRHRKKT